VSGGKMQDSELSLRGTYTEQPAVLDGSVAIGGGRTHGAMYGWVSEVAVWNYMLSEAETQAVRQRYRTVAARPAWAADVSLPDPGIKVANEAKVGLPALWLE